LKLIKTEVKKCMVSHCLQIYLLKCINILIRSDKHVTNTISILFIHTTNSIVSPCILFIPANACICKYFTNALIKDLWEKIGVRVQCINDLCALHMHFYIDNLSYHHDLSHN